MTDQLLDGLTDEQVRGRPHGVNSIAWLLWHIWLLGEEQRPGDHRQAQQQTRSVPHRAPPPGVQAIERDRRSGGLGRTSYSMAPTVNNGCMVSLAAGR